MPQLDIVPIALIAANGSYHTCIYRIDFRASGSRQVDPGMEIPSPADGMCPLPIIRGDHCIHRQWRSRRYRHYYLSVRSVPRKDWLLPAHGGLAIRPCKYLRQLGRLPVFPPLLQLLHGNWCCQKTHHLILFITILPRYLGIVLPQYFIFPRLYILHGKYHCQCRNTQHCLRHQ